MSGDKQNLSSFAVKLSQIRYILKNKSLHLNQDSISTMTYTFRNSVALYE